MKKRIVSLLPSATEIVCALGARDELAGVSHECDYPAGVSSLPVLTRARELGGTSAAIDGAVRGILESALAIYDIELERLREVAPDVIVTQDLCDVCAVSLDDVRSAVMRLARQDVNIVNLHPTRLSDIWADVVRVGEAIGREREAATLVATCQGRIERIAERARRARGARAAPRVLTIEWIAPVMIGGLWMPELVRAAGGEPLVTDTGEHAPTLSLEALEQLDPDVVVVKPCGFGLARTLEEVPALATALPWARWRAVREGRVYLADGNAFFNRPGPRIVESLEILAACLYPHELADLASTHATSMLQVQAG